MVYWFFIAWAAYAYGFYWFGKHMATNQLKGPKRSYDSRAEHEGRAAETFYSWTLIGGLFGGGALALLSSWAWFIGLALAVLAGIGFGGWWFFSKQFAKIKEAAK